MGKMGAEKSKKGIRKKQIPIADGLFTLPANSSEKGRLIGGKCSICGKVVFPKQTITICPSCHGESMEEVLLNTKGKVHACTVFRYKKPPPGFGGKVVPYSYGYVELVDGVIVPALYTDCDLNGPLKVGTEVEMVMEEFVEDDEGNDIVTYKFRPA